MRKFKICNLRQILVLLSYDIKTYEMGGIYGTYGRQTNMHIGFRWRNMKGRDYLKDQSRVLKVLK
jgi:hypothetical protein